MNYLKIIKIIAGTIRIINRKAYLRFLLTVFSTAPRKKNLQKELDYGFEITPITLTKDLKATFYRTVYSDYADIAVILANGWGGRFWNFEHFLRLLFDKRIHIIGFDAPAHGNAPGRYSNILAFKESIKYGLKEASQYEKMVVIGHSLGAAAAALAIKETPELKINHFISIAAPSDMLHVFNNFAHLMAVSEKNADALKAYIKSKVGFDFNKERLINMDLPQNIVNTILIHDRQDKDVNFKDAINLARRWGLDENKDLWPVENTGHFKILKYHPIIERISAEIKG